MSGAGWLQSAADLLNEPDPGPTPFLVDRLLVDQAIAAIVGPPKAGKTFLLLDLAIAIVTGSPALGRYGIPKRGPVVIVLEESGRTALHRRLDALARGRAIKPAELRDLHFAANARVRLNEGDWQQKLVAAAEQLRPRAILLDPLVRLKGAGVDESSQKEMGPVLDYMRDLRDTSGALVGYVHHTGHAGDRQRGTSDLEAYWESKLTLTRKDDGTCEITAEHREAEATGPIAYRRTWDEATRTMRLEGLDEPRVEALRADVLAHLEECPGASAEEVAKAIHKRRPDVLSELQSLKRRGTVITRQSERRDSRGRSRSYHGWYLAQQSQLVAVPNGRTAMDGEPFRDDPPSHRPAPIGGGRSGTAVEGWSDEELQALIDSEREVV